jgi:O-methyltransferase involved in polyketide biosynthesis
VLVGARVQVTCRGRYAEDALARAAGAGVTQYVLLGAGLDSFAYRGGPLAGRVRVFEVDHPATAGVAGGVVRGRDAVLDGPVTPSAACGAARSGRAARGRRTG